MLLQHCLSSNQAVPHAPGQGGLLLLCPLYVLFCRNTSKSWGWTCHTSLVFLEAIHYVIRVVASQHDDFYDTFACAGPYTSLAGREAGCCGNGPSDQSWCCGQNTPLLTFTDSFLAKLLLNLSGIFICLVIFIINLTIFVWSPSYWRQRTYVRISQI